MAETSLSCRFFRSGFQRFNFLSRKLRQRIYFSSRAAHFESTMRAAPGSDMPKKSASPERVAMPQIFVGHAPTRGDYFSVIAPCFNDRKMRERHA